MSDIWDSLLGSAGFYGGDDEEVEKERTCPRPAAEHTSCESDTGGAAGSPASLPEKNAIPEERAAAAFAKPPQLDAMMAVIRNRVTGEMRVVRMEPDWEVLPRLKLPKEAQPCRRRSGKS